jgi:ABC-2 type transport system permease protein
MILRLCRATLRRDLLEAATYKTYAVSRLGGLAGLLFSAWFVARTFAGHEPPGLTASGGYFGFLVIGVSLSDLAWALFAGPADRVRQAQLAGTLEAELASPVPVLPWLFAQSVFPVLGASLRAVLGAVVALTLADRLPSADRLPGLCLASGLTVLALWPVGLLGGALTLLLKRADPIGRGLHAASMLLAGVAYPVSVLPETLQSLATALPTTHALTALRDALFGHVTAGPLLALGGFAVAGWVAVPPLVRRLDGAARRRGTLVQY